MLFATTIQTIRTNECFSVVVGASVDVTCDKDWLSRLDDDDLATNLLLELTLRVGRRSCSSCSLYYDTPPSPNVVLDNRISRSFPEVATRRAFSRRL